MILINLPVPDDRLLYVSGTPGTSHQCQGQTGPRDVPRTHPAETRQGQPVPVGYRHGGRRSAGERESHLPWQQHSNQGNGGLSQASRRKGMFSNLSISESLNFRVGYR